LIGPGKTALSRFLAGKYDFRIYNLNWHYGTEDRFRTGPAVRPRGARLARRGSLRVAPSTTL